MWTLGNVLVHQAQKFSPYGVNCGHCLVHLVPQNNWKIMFMARMRCLGFSQDNCTILSNPWTRALLRSCTETVVFENYSTERFYFLWKLVVVFKGYSILKIDCRIFQKVLTIQHKWKPCGSIIYAELIEQFVELFHYSVYFSELIAIFYFSYNPILADILSAPLEIALISKM